MITEISNRYLCHAVIPDGIILPEWTDAETALPQTSLTIFQQASPGWPGPNTSPKTGFATCGAGSKI